jgi:hypothetical protein
MCLILRLVYYITTKVEVNKKCPTVLQVIRKSPAAKFLVPIAELLQEPKTTHIIEGYGYSVCGKGLEGTASVIAACGLG